jgi:hypothetical protein
MIFVNSCNVKIKSNACEERVKNQNTYTTKKKKKNQKMAMEIMVIEK